MERSSSVSRYQGRISGVVDVDDTVSYGDVVVAVVILDVAAQHVAPVRGEDVCTYTLKVKDMAVVDDDVMRKQLYYHLPHLAPIEAQFEATPVPEHILRRRAALESTATSAPEEEYVEIPDTTVTVEAMSPDDVLVHDGEDGEIFNPADESRERGRFNSSVRDPILARFLRDD